MIKIAAVIPFHHRMDSLDLAIRSLGDLRVYVVNDGEQSLSLPENCVLLETCTTSSGFARASNLGIATAQADGFTHVLLLNDDAAVDPECLDLLSSRISPDLGVIGPILISPDSSISADIKVSSWGRVKVSKKVPPTLSEVDAICGACMLMPSWVRFDSGYLHGFEDIDLCRRLRKMGLKVLLEPAARCFHFGQGSLSRDNPLRQQYAVFGHMRFLRGAAVPFSLSILQVMRERGGISRIKAIFRGARQWFQRNSSAA